MDIDKVYQVLKGKNKQLECNKCKHIWELKSTTMHSEFVKNENGQEMLIHFFLCPKCNEIYVVSIIDSKVRTYEEKISKLDKKINRMVRKGTKPIVEISKRDKLRSDMMTYESFVKNKYSKYLHLVIEEGDH